jgi:hypothetical protein
MITTEALGVMEEPIETVGGHATEAQTGRDPRIAVDSGAEMPAETSVVSGTIPATEGVAVPARRIPLPAAMMAAARGHARRMGPKERTPRCALTPVRKILVPQLTQARSRSQLSLHLSNRRPRWIKRLSDCGNSKP